MGGPGATLLVLADGRLPAGGHAHSGGLEEAVAAGRVQDVPSLGAFLAGRLATAGLVAAALAAAACSGRHAWDVLDAEADARTASPALRESSRRQGRQLLRTARTLWGGPLLEEVVASGGAEGPHHAVAVGAVASAAGLGPADAALIAAHGSISGPAAAAVRLLSFDPVAVHGLLARLTGAVDRVAARAAAAAAAGPAGDLPAATAPLLEVGAESHDRREGRLFGS